MTSRWQPQTRSTPCRYVRHFTYRPNDLEVGSGVQFRVDGGHGYVERENGKEVKCSIIRVEKAKAD
jgi:hypothetical protein